ncbi:MAG: hypothetical protein IJ071_03785 [Ruminococcus sp.]|nr:hypothetical protein [Ruminococcus sp.]
MRKTPIIAVLLTAAVLSGCGDKQSNKKPGLYIPAYSMTVYRQYPGEEAVIDEYYEYDKYDNLLAEKGVYFDGMAEQETSTTYRYSEDGRTRMIYSPDGELLQTETTNDNGDILRTDMYFDNEIASSDVYTYDEHDNLLTVVHQAKGRKDEISEQYEYEYDGDGKLIESRDISPNTGADSIITRYTYDENGLLIRSDCERKFGEGFSENTEYTLYDKNGNKTEYGYISVYPDLDERYEGLFKYYYNDDGKIVKEESFFDGEPGYTIEYKYADL